MYMCIERLISGRMKRVGRERSPLYRNNVTRSCIEMFYKILLYTLRCIARIFFD